MTQQATSNDATFAGSPAVPRTKDDLQSGRRLPFLCGARAIGPRRISAVYLWIGFMILFGLLKPGVFLTWVTVRLVFSQGAVTCLVALAFLVPLVAGAYDLSVGAVMSTSIAIGAWVQLHTSLPPVVGALISIIACTLIGCVSGFIIVRLKVNSFIATLGVSQVLLALVLLLSNNQQLVASYPNSWSNLALNNVLGIPLVVVYLVVIALVLWYVFEHTHIGRYLFAVGGNPEAARLSGVPTARLTYGALATSGAIAGIAGVIYGMRVGTFDASVGPGYLFPAVAAVFLGASQFSQRPNVWGTLIAYFALAFGVQGLALSSASAAVWSQPLFEGVALILAVAITTVPALRRRLKSGLAASGAAVPAASSDKDQGG